MNRLVILSFLFCLIAASANAQTPPRLPDLSLSPADTLREPNVTYNHSPFVPAEPVPSPQINEEIVPGLAQDGDDDDTQEAPGTPSGAGFMSGYCDPNFKAGIGVNDEIRACLLAGRQGQCEKFRQLPTDAQHLLDHAIGCLYSASEEDRSAAAIDPSCSQDDHQRLNLIKKYWRDPDISYALVFLPDRILRGSSECLSNRGRGF